MSSFSRLATLATPLVVLAAAACGSAPRHSAPAPRSTVTSADMQNSDEPIEYILQRRVPGLQVKTTSGGGIALRIRGSAAEEMMDLPPLYILNGLPFHTGPEGELTGINPSDIESVKVLKGAEAAMYGIDGANGVIVITTKRVKRPRS